MTFLILRDTSNVVLYIYEELRFMYQVSQGDPIAIRRPLLYDTAYTSSYTLIGNSSETSLVINALKSKCYILARLAETPWYY